MWDWVLVEHGLSMTNNHKRVETTTSLTLMDFCIIANFPFQSMASKKAIGNIFHCSNACYSDLFLQLLVIISGPNVKKVSNFKMICSILLMQFRQYPGIWEKL